MALFPPLPHFLPRSDTTSFRIYYFFNPEFGHSFNHSKMIRMAHLNYFPFNRENSTTRLHLYLDKL